MRDNLSMLVSGGERVSRKRGDRTWNKDSKRAARDETTYTGITSLAKLRDTSSLDEKEMGG